MKFSYTINEATAAIGIGRTKLYREIADGKITPRKLGQRTIILAADLEDYVKSLPTACAEGKS